ncbi:STAS domain-containing protein [Rhodocyclus tenuis]|uniref:Anti-sigma factor antagonist n=1 Tax=Rhodocyclus tenuis TaxID=1066 RepID=A0A840GES2_RHOTE|nr:STAS domain-containing protein [Rhodocyclus tenuis]MBB4246719.1 anti-anti-sigma factor [Rhodocyclus tenuis]MBK1680013.1 anti-anti-sigma factor [Rhodocyclus tenuis]
MQASTTSENGEVTVRLSGRFDFSAHRAFRDAFELALADARARSLTIDLGGVDYVDSSALGMLLVLREKADAVGRSVALTNARGTVKQVLDIANFRKLFTFV